MTSSSSSSVDNLVPGFADLLLSPLEKFFASFPNFTYKPTANAATESKRLCKRHKNASHDAFNEAFEAEFNARFGGGGGGEVWDPTRLCERLDIDPMPASITQARKARILISSRKWSSEGELMNGVGGERYPCQHL